MVSQPLNLYEQDHPNQRVKRSEMKDVLAFIGAWYLISLLHLFIIKISFSKTLDFDISLKQDKAQPERKSSDERT